MIKKNYKIDCFAFNSGLKGKRPSCTALKILDCEKCKFYKAKEQSGKEN